MDPKIWGPHAWFFLHTMAFAYPYKPRHDQQHTMKQFLLHLGGTLPCQACQQHYQQHLQKRSLDAAVLSKDNLFKWMVDIHNDVNRQLGKPEMSLDNAYKKYREKYGLEADHQYMDQQDKPIPSYLWVILVLVVIIGLTRFFWPQIKQLMPEHNPLKNM